MANSSWMSSLPDNVRNNIAIINLAIPGSHNSMMYGITSKTAPDANSTTRTLNYCFPYFVKRWAKTQSATVLEQLELGVRYFDLRVCQKDNNFYYVHGLYSLEAFEPLYQLKEFLIKRPKEVVILDFQHFYEFNDHHHVELVERILNLFNQMLYGPAHGNLIDCTLNRCAELQKQILIIYRRCPIQLPPEFWSSYVWPTPWPNKASIKELESFLKISLQARGVSQGYVSQCLLTPTGRYITFRFFSSLRRVAKRVDRKLRPWIAEQKPGPFSPGDSPKVNVVIADYVELNKFCDWVINLNTKLYESSKDTSINEQYDNTVEITLENNINNGGLYEIANGI